MSPSSSHLPDQPTMKYVYPADRLRFWFGVAVGLAVLVGMLTFGILSRNFGTLEHLKALNEAGSWLTVSLIEASAGILALLLAAVALGEWIERGVEGPHFISLIRPTARSPLFQSNVASAPRSTSATACRSYLPTSWPCLRPDPIGAEQLALALELLAVASGSFGTRGFLGLFGPLGRLLRMLYGPLLVIRRCPLIVRSPLGARSPLGFF